jgi:two-component system, OmpR family, KDP operon response regulator KdpE
MDASMPDVPAVALVIDDDVQIRRFLRAGFEFDGFRVIEAANGAAGLAAAAAAAPDLIVLDLALPDMDGSRVIERLRPWSDVAIIVLSARSAEDEKVRVLELGADDYVVKPFGMIELRARARAALRRRSRRCDGGTVVAAGPLSIDLASRKVLLNGTRVDLTRQEYRLLEILARHCDNVVTHRQLLKEIWNPAQGDFTPYLRILVRRLRAKVEADPAQPRLIVTDLGVGYRLAQPDAPEPALARAAWQQGPQTQRAGGA